MEAAFWRERWANNQIGFHKNSPNSKLLEHAPRLSLSQGQRVLLPLCGKSLDLLWWRNQGLAVTGIELSEIACRDFFIENSLSFTLSANQYQSESLTLVQGDFFDYKAQETFDFIYDRASNIALPPQLRPQYYKHLKEMMTPGLTTLFLITIEYNQTLIEGPPFSVGESEINEAYKGMKIELIQDQLIEMDNPRFEGLEVREKIYFISPF